MSHTFEFPAIPQKKYEMWILAEDRIDVIHELKWTSFVFEMAVKEARVKSREARLACGYDTSILQPDAEDDNDGGIWLVGGQFLV